MHARSLSFHSVFYTVHNGQSSEQKSNTKDDDDEYCYTDIGRSSLYIAAGRAIESKRAGRDRLFTDPYADHFAKSGNNSGYTFMSMFADALTEQNKSKGIMGEVTADYFSMFTAFRTRWIDDSIYAALQRDKQRMREGKTKGTIKQIVIVAVGCDTRCYRLSKLPPDCRLYHVDTEVAIRFRNKVVDNTDLGICPHIDVVIPVQTEKGWGDGQWMDKLVASGFDAQRKSIWICEGILEHLESNALNGLMSTIRDNSVEGSWFIGEMPNVVNCGMKDMWDSWCDLGGKRAVSGVDLPKYDILDKYGFNAFQNINILGTAESNYHDRAPESYVKHQMSSKPMKGDKIARIQMFRGMKCSDADDGQNDEKSSL